MAYQNVITFKYYQVRVLCNTNMFEINEKSKYYEGLNLRPFRILEKLHFFSQKEQFCSKMSDENVPFVL